MLFTLCLLPSLSHAISSFLTWQAKDTTLDVALLCMMHLIRMLAAHNSCALLGIVLLPQESVLAKVKMHLGVADLCCSRFES
jgi:hypothetical protein